MSNQTVVLNNGTVLHVDNDFNKVFIGRNEYEGGFTFNNNTGGQATFPVGTLVGRRADNGKIVALASGTGTQGENIPLGVLAQEITDLADAADVTDITICVAGKVAEEKLDLQGADTLDTVISTRRLRDRILGDTKGVILIASDDLTNFDNQ